MIMSKLMNTSKLLNMPKLMNGKCNVDSSYSKLMNDVVCNINSSGAKLKNRLECNTHSSDALVSKALNLIAAFCWPHLIHTAIELKIYDHVSNKPMSNDELAKATGTHYETLVLCMQALSKMDVFKLDDNQKWTTTQLSTVLFRKLKHYANYWMDQHSILNKLTDTVKTGTNHYEEYYGLPFYDLHKTKPRELETFNYAMTEFGTLVGAKLTQMYNFSQFKRIVDIGGGRGQFMIQMLQSAPNAKGTVFDDPHVIKAALENNEEAEDVEHRISFIGGNALNSVPSGGDCYTIRNVLNDFNDTKALKILKNIANEMNGNSKLLIIEMDRNTNFAPLYALHKFIVIEGVLRGVEGYQKLLPKVGLQIKKCLKGVGETYEIIEVIKNIQ